MMVCGFCLWFAVFVWVWIGCSCGLGLGVVVGYLLVLFGLVVPVVSDSFTYRLTLVAGFECGVLVC